MKPLNNHTSLLLTNEQNNLIIELLGTGQRSLFTTVAQVYFTEGKETPHSEWRLKYTGVLCITKDNPKKTFFFQLYSFDELVWQEEFYGNMEYFRSQIFLHVFEGSQGVVGFNFAHTGEADEFYNIALAKMKFLTQALIKAGKLAPVAKPQGKLQKTSISAPMDFRHLQHVGFQSEKGFDLKLTSRELQSFFDKMDSGDERVVKGRAARRVIKTFVDQFGVETVRQAITEDIYEPVPPRTCSAGKPNVENIHTHDEDYYSGMPTCPPPPLPAIFESSRSPPVPPRSPTIPIGMPPPPPNIPALKEPKKKNNALMRSGGVLPPPPPLPKLNAPPQPPKPPRMAPPPFPDDGATATSGSDTVVPDERANLLNSIKAGIKLKPVEERTLNNEISADGDAGSNPGDILNALKEALMKRNNVLASDESDDEASSGNDSDWD